MLYTPLFQAGINDIVSDASPMLLINFYHAFSNAGKFLFTSATLCRPAPVRKMGYLDSTCIAMAMGKGEKFLLKLIFQ